MAGPIHIVIPGTERSFCGADIVPGYSCQLATADPLIRARQLGADIPEVCVDCIVAGRPA